LFRPLQFPRSGRANPGYLQRGLQALAAMNFPEASPVFPKREEGRMFQMINEERPSAEDARMRWLKVGAFVVIAAAIGGVIYFFAFVPYMK
jgi:hypothetical protein